MENPLTEGPGTILGGLPVIAVVASGKDADTPIGPGEYWSEVQAIYWRKRDGTKGKELPEHIVERAEKYDYAFCDLCDQVFDHFHHQKWLAEQEAKAMEARQGPDPQGLDGNRDSAGRQASPHPHSE